MSDQFLEILSGIARGRRVPLGDKTDIGKRPTSELVLEDAGISWNHARILSKNGKLWIADRNSTNGTRVDGKRIGPSWVRLREGMALRFARTEACISGGSDDVGAPRKRGDSGELTLPPEAEAWDTDFDQESDKDHATEKIAVQLIEQLAVESEPPRPRRRTARQLPAREAPQQPSSQQPPTMKRKTGEFAPPSFDSAELEKDSLADPLADPLADLLDADSSVMKGAVLIVDEDDAFLYWAASALKKEGYRITTADEGIEALLPLTKRQSYALVLCGLHPGRLEQLQLFDNVRMSGLSTPVLFASSSEEARALAEKLGGREFLRKPVSKEELLAAVARHASKEVAATVPASVLEKLERIDDFLIEQKLGKGGMGTVYLATQISLKRKVALKVLGPARGDDAHAARILSEARTAASLVHPNVVQIYTVGLHEKTGRPYFAMEYVKGRTIAEAEALSFGAILDLLEAVTSALLRASEKGIVHRDIKPGNIMLTEADEVKVLDFGLARVANADRLTATGVVLGSPVYMSPEQAGGRDLDVRSDLYSLGVVLYELLAGARPFEADTSAGMIFLHAFCQPRSITAVRRNVPKGFEKMLGNLLAKSPDDRMQPAALIDEVKNLRAALGSRLEQLPEGPRVEPLNFSEAQDGTPKGPFLGLGDQASASPGVSGLTLGLAVLGGVCVLLGLAGWWIWG